MACRMLASALNVDPTLARGDHRGIGSGSGVPEPGNAACRRGQADVAGGAGSAYSTPVSRFGHPLAAAARGRRAELYGGQLSRVHGPVLTGKRSAVMAPRIL
jgi:hypothetical protein